MRVEFENSYEGGDSRVEMTDVLGRDRFPGASRKTTSRFARANGAARVPRRAVPGPTLAALACVLSSCALGEVGATRLGIDIDVQMRQDEPGIGESYEATYRHRAVHTTSDLALESSVSNAAWSGYEMCFDPPHKVAWESSIDFESFGFDRPDFHVLVRDGVVWLLYDPVLDFGVVHAGRPPCDSANGVAPGTTVSKRFSSGDLEELPSSEGESPVYVRSVDQAVGGFVLVTAPLAEFGRSEGIAIGVERTLEEGDFSISLEVKGIVRAKS